MRQADSIVVTTFPADVVQDLQDFILWQPDALETGVEAVYVMVSDP
ncbi:S-type pyocin domain-containing protein, partial [Serratia marcescens]